MNPKYRRLFIITLIILTIAVATQLVLIALRDNIVYFYTPNELKNKYADSKNIESKIRVGGLVLENSVIKNKNIVEFIDLIGENHSSGSLPYIVSLFDEFEKLK